VTNEDLCHVPETNFELLRYLFSIENALRELIIERLALADGPLWYKRRMPGDVLEQCRKGLAYERSTKWTVLVLHHPIYYVDFPNLKKILLREDNWTQTFQSVFGRKDILEAMLTELEPVRNRVAHNRRTTDRDVTIAKSVLGKLVSAVSGERFSALLARAAACPDVYSYLSSLRGEIEDSCRRCESYESLGGLPIWNKVNSEWWFDGSYLGIDVEGVREYFVLMETYAALPRLRGTGHSIEQWVKGSGLTAAHARASAIVSTLLESGRQIPDGL
jgi:Swt1-like HEPN